MASARAELKTVISADSSQFSTAMRRAGMVASETGSKIRKSFSGKIAGAFTAAGSAIAGAFAVSTFASGIKGAADLGGALSDLSARTGIAAGRLALLGRAFEDNGVSADKIGGVINKLQKTIFEFGTGTEKTAKVFAELGITFEEISRLSPDQQFAMVQKAIAGIEDPAKRAALAMQLFGKAGGELLTLFGDAGALNAAGTTLGTAAEILDRRAATFDSISDILARAGAKLQSFFIGVLDVVADDLLKILEDFDKLDLAKMGQEFGQIMGAIDWEKADVGGTIYQSLEGIKQLVDWTYKLFQLFDKVTTLIGVNFANLFSPEVWQARFDLLTTGFKIIIETLAQALGNLFSGDTFKKLITSGLSGESAFEMLGQVVGDAFNKVDLGDKLKQQAKDVTAVNAAIGQEMLDKLTYVFSPLKGVEDIIPKTDKEPTKPPKVEIQGPPKPTEPESKEPSPETAGGLVFGNKVESGKAGGGTWKDRMKKAVAKVLDAKDKKEKTNEEEGGVALKESAEKIKAKEKEDANLQAALQKMEEKQLAKRQASAARAAMFANGGLAMSNSRLIGGGLSVDYASRGVASGLTTGGLGEKRRLATSKDQREAKKALTAQEQQLDKLSSIDSNIKQALTVA